MIKVNFKQIEEVIINFDGTILAEYIFCDKIKQLKSILTPVNLVNTLYLPIDKDYIQSIEHVKPTDL